MGLTTDHCVKCGYDVTGLTSGVCPSCGTRFISEAALPPRQLDQPGFLRGVVFMYIITGPVVILFYKWPLALLALGLFAPIGAPASAILLGMKWGLKWTAGRGWAVRGAACVGVMIALLAASAGAWWWVLRGFSDRG